MHSIDTVLWAVCFLWVVWLLLLLWTCELHIWLLWLSKFWLWTLGTHVTPVTHCHYTALWIDLWTLLTLVMNLQWILSSDLSYCHLPVIWLLDSCLLFRSTWARTLVSQLTLGINVNRQRSIKLFNPCDLIFSLVNKSLGLLLLVLSIWILVPNQNPCDLLWISSEQTFEKYENIKR